MKRHPFGAACLANSGSGSTWAMLDWSKPLPPGAYESPPPHERVHSRHDGSICCTCVTDRQTRCESKSGCRNSARCRRWDGRKSPRVKDSFTGRGGIPANQIGRWRKPRSGSAGFMRDSRRSSYGSAPHTSAPTTGDGWRAGGGPVLLGHAVGVCPVVEFARCLLCRPTGWECRGDRSRKRCVDRSRGIVRVLFHRALEPRHRSMGSSIHRRRCMSSQRSRALRFWPLSGCARRRECASAVPRPGCAALCARGRG